MARVAVREARQTGHDVLQALSAVGHGQVQQDAGTRADPQQILAGEQRGDPQAGRLVLANYVVAAGQHLVYRIAHVDLEQQLMAAGRWKRE